MGDNVPAKMSNTQLRKIKKPLIERRRRERINDCLNQLKDLIFEATNTQESRYTKLEKADILEMTVQHLRQKMQHTRREPASFLQSSSSSSSQSPLQTSPATPFSPSSGVDSAAAAARFSTGYLACAQEVQRCLGILPLDVTQQSRLCEHLAGCLQKLQHQQQQAAADLSADVFRHHHGLQQQQVDRSTGGRKLAVPSKRHASLSSASSMTSSPPASPTNRRFDAVSPHSEVASHRPVNGGTPLLSPAGSNSTDVFSVSLLPNSVPLLLHKVIQWPSEASSVPAATTGTGLPDDKSGVHITCSPLYMSHSQPLKLESHQNGVAFTLVPAVSSVPIVDSRAETQSSSSGSSSSSFMHPKKRIRYSCSPITVASTLTDSTHKLSPLSSSSSSSSISGLETADIPAHAGTAWRPW